MKSLVVTLISFMSGMGCLIAYNVIGVKIAPDGTLIEPFYLIPLTYLCFLLGIIMLIVTWLNRKFRNRTKSSLNHHVHK